MNKKGGVFAYIFWIAVGIAIGVWAAFNIL